MPCSLQRLFTTMPARAGIQVIPQLLDSRFRENDEREAGMMEESVGIIKEGRKISSENLQVSQINLYWQGTMPYFPSFSRVARCTGRPACIILSCVASISYSTRNSRKIWPSPSYTA